MLLNTDTLKASLRHKLQKVDHDRVSAYSWILDQKKKKINQNKKTLLNVTSNGFLRDPWRTEPWFQPHMQICANTIWEFLA